jgi:pimeloyl-ACP methyl ester carboxylesterase
MRKRGIPWLLAALCAVSAAAAAAVGVLDPGTHADGVQGIWQGALRAGAIELRVVFRITRTDDGILTATLDSPDQGATGIPVDELAVDGGSVRMEVRSVRGVFQGTLAEDGSALRGAWSQSGVNLPLALQRVDEVTEPRRPQEPAGPLPYREEEVRYENEQGGATLAGTLTLPNVPGPYPAVLLVSGSGQQDRNETVFGHRPFLILADYLTRRGLAVLRADDRGIGGSTGDVVHATSEDFASDVLAGLEYLNTRPETAPRRIGLLGHSEGGLIGAMVAARSDDVAFLVMLAGPGVTGEEILYRQAELIAAASGAGPEVISRNRDLQARLFGVLKQETDDAIAQKKLEGIITAAMEEMGEEEREAIGLPDEAVELQVQALLSPWFRFILTYDPGAALCNVKCPVLAINGEKDLQVPAEDNLQAIRVALRAGANEDCTIQKLPGLNHLFQTAETGAPSEYGKIEETISPGVLQMIGDWVMARVGVDEQ